MPCVYPRSPAMLLSPKIISAAGQLKSPAMQDINDCMALSTADVPEHTAVLESIHFFNTRLLPEVAPAHAPFQRVHIAAAGWLTMIMSPQHASHRYSCSRRSLIPTSCDFVARRRAHSTPGDETARTSAFDDIQESIAQFDPLPWVTRILNYGSSFPRPAAALFFAEEDTAAIISLTLCHQAAVMLYLYLSCSPGISNQETDPHLISPTHQILTTNLSKFLARSSLDTEGPIHTQLYKFVTWWLVIAAYARVGWVLGAAEDVLEGDADQDLERLRFAASTIGSRPLIEAAGVMEIRETEGC
jgi:hypothetical protein